ncbi:MAG TPA: mechanosensitive ion channel family protein [Polyangiaceae bacterium]|jgi:small-conductance mechanosensitive channel|nr:mechanosensitive ion channel family protein [Polyangiaceae bacterium]
MNQQQVMRAVDFFTTDRLVDGVRAIALFFITALFASLLGRWVRRLVALRGDMQRALLVSRLVTWSFLALGLAGALEEMGFKLNAVLGAAGVLTVAVGFAAQTTLSNLISGFFLFGERPFRVGDLIEVDTLLGEVLSVDMMATTLRTPDNRFVRIPNELVLKTKVTNHTRFPLRRLDLTVALGHHEDFGAVRALLLDVADKNTLCLAEPAPTVFIASMGESSAQVQLWLWTRTDQLQALRASITAEIQAALAASKRATAAAS